MGLKDVFKQKIEMVMNKKRLTMYDEQKINLIQNFPIPSTKEDIPPKAQVMVFSVSTLTVLGANRAVLM